jgi:antitoxin (DNA-binding transcriptional repressor) of toxin-antitoxin stability system
MKLTATRLRADLYKVLDRVIQTGEPAEIERKGRRLKIVPVRPKGFRWEQLEAHPDYIVGDPKDLVHMDWSREWKPFI